MHAWGNDPVGIKKCVHSGMGKLQGVDNWLFDTEGTWGEEHFFEMLSDSLTAWKIKKCLQSICSIQGDCYIKAFNISARLSLYILNVPSACIK